ncbi:MAG TPA: ketoacyl-ACP synthase III [Gammaproteobacteria bacterium]|nr:ketoacyl-ACP synthase III [Gammaproteobacteria bacterium]
MSNSRRIPVKICGTGEALPERVVYSTEIDKRENYRQGHTEKVTGIKSRYYATEESASDMAVKAIEHALINSQLGLEEIDCLIAASGTMEQAIPCNGARILAQLGTDRCIPAFDINMTCLSSLMSMDVAASLLQTHAYKNILVVSSDIASVGIDWRNIETGGIFGDGAAAYIVSRAESAQQGIIASRFSTYKEGLDYCQIQGGGSLNHPSKVAGDYQVYGQFRMKGKEIYRLAAKLIPDFVNDLLESADLSIKNIDWVVPHQASALALKHIQKRLKIPADRMITIYPRRGNQIAVSIPATLHALIESYPIKRGDKILFLGTSAGMSIGATILEY